jgi:hypothetical protein
VRLRFSHVVNLVVGQWFKSKCKCGQVDVRWLVSDKEISLLVAVFLEKSAARQPVRCVISRPPNTPGRLRTFTWLPRSEGSISRSARVGEI